MIDIGLIIIIAVVVITLITIRWILSLRTIVPPKYADVVTRKNSVQIYSADNTVTGTNTPVTVYYRFPAWMPVIGVYVKRMPLTIIEIPVLGYKTFAKGNARFVVDVSVYCRINNVMDAAQKFPGETIDDFIKGIREIIVSAIRKTTATFAVEDVIAKRSEIALDVQNDIRDDVQKWGVELLNVAIVDIKDPMKLDRSGAVMVDQNGHPIVETTVIHDISAKKEAEISSLSRQEIANKKRAAEIVEAETREQATTRSLQADEVIGKREQERNQNIAIEKQKAVTKDMEVIRAQTVMKAEIDADAEVKRSEGTKRAAIQIAEGNKQKFELEGQGEAKAIEAKGTANAEITKAMKFAEADGLSRYADAQAKQQELAIAIREIEKNERIGLALAQALAEADIKFYGSGDPKKFMDLFTAGGGLSVGAGLSTFLDILKGSDPDSYDKIMNVVDQSSSLKKLIGSPGSSSGQKFLNSPSTPPSVSNTPAPAVSSEPTMMPDKISSNVVSKNMTPEEFADKKKKTTGTSKK
jgi:flotillin